MIVTNGERIGEGLPLRQFRVLATDGPQSWVIALNGNYEGERLTFDTSALRPFTPGEV